MNESEIILAKINNYYTNKIRAHGATPLGVDWKNEETQYLRFEKLIQLFNLNPQQSFTINDFGCGYASLYNFLSSKNLAFFYYGNDLSQAMIDEADLKLASNKNYKLSINPKCQNKSDFSVSSGIFNVKLDMDNTAWESYIKSIMRHLYEASTTAFSFNCLTLYSDVEYRRNDLYYADPLYFFDYCKKNFSKKVSILHDYNLYEFTLTVFK